MLQYLRCSCPYICGVAVFLRHDLCRIFGAVFALTDARRIAPVTRNSKVPAFTIHRLFIFCKLHHHRYTINK